MFLSKIWFVLIGLVAGVATMAAFVAPRTADRRIEHLEGQRLDRAQYAAEQMLKTDAHRWIDYVAKLGRDAILMEALDGASRGVGEPKVIHETVRNRLRTLVPDLPAIGVDTLTAVDARGRIVARIGDGENEFGDSQAGVEILADALRGYLSDDVSGVDGKLQRLAATPVLSKTRDRIVGAVAVGAETGKRLAELWKKNLGVEVAVLLRGQVVSSTLPESFLSTVTGLIEQRRPEMIEAKRTRAIPFLVGPDRLLAVAAPFAGQASQQEAYYVLIGKPEPASNPLQLLSNTTADDLRWGTFPWPGLILGLALILGVGLWLQRNEMERPLSNLRAEVQRLARGDLQKLRDTDYAGKFGGIARDVNATIERFTHAPIVRSGDSGKKDISSPGGYIPEGKAFDLSAAGSHFPDRPRTGGPMLGTASALGATPQQRLVSPNLTPAPSGMRNLPGGPPMPPPTAVAASMPPRFAPPVFSAPSFAPPVVPTPAVPAWAPTPLPPAPDLDLDLQPGGTPPQAPSPFREELDDEQTIGNDLVESKTKTIDPEDAHINEVYADYVLTRQKCGEAIGSLTLEKFRAKLDANRLALIAKYNCKSARFSVYVKDGKAAIKAAPVR